MSAPLVVILMGSRSDEAHARRIGESCERLGLDRVLRVASAHKTPGPLLGILASFEADPRPKAYITIAGRSNALSGFVDGAVSAPVIACPPPTEAYGGADIWSSLRMPSGIAPAFVMDGANAALLAAKILAPHDATVRERLRDLRKAMADELAAADRELGGQAAAPAPFPTGAAAPSPAGAAAPGEGA